MVSCSTNQPINQPIHIKMGPNYRHQSQPTNKFSRFLVFLLEEHISHTINSRLSTLNFISPQKNQGSFLLIAKPNKTGSTRCFRGKFPQIPQPWGPNLLHGLRGHATCLVGREGYHSSEVGDFSLLFASGVFFLFDEILIATYILCV